MLETYQEANTSWADALPKAQGLYDPDNEKDSCGVGFIVCINGTRDHKILHDAKGILCNMTHRGAVGADTRDGDGAGVMTAIPHLLFEKDLLRDHNITIPKEGEYATGNVFLKPDEVVLKQSQNKFTEIAHSLGLNVLCWRIVSRDNSILGPSGKSKEPVIIQPFIVLQDNGKPFDDQYFNRQLYLLRKKATHALTLKKWFYICSLSNKTITYKGLLSPAQVYAYFDDLENPDYHTHFALVHSRFSTNTFPSWDRAQPMRWCAHNGEINTLRGNKNWMRAREGLMKSELLGKDLEACYPIIENGGSDSAAFDNVLELLLMNKVVTLPEAVMMMIPEAWQNQTDMNPEKRAFYEWASCLMEPWDGPALFTFSDGRYVGASLDRNGLRPCRFYITGDGKMICASEVGTVKIDPSQIVSKGRLQPGKMLLVDTLEGKVVDDSELKMSIAASKPYGQWLDQQLLTMESVRRKYVTKNNGFTGVFLDNKTVHQDPRMLAFGFNLETLNIIISPMVTSGSESLGSMGIDIPLACLSQKPRLVYDYFRQLFAQVTNPPIDPIRETIVMSLTCYVGPEGNILETKPDQCHRLQLPSPILSITDLFALKQMEASFPGWGVVVIELTYPRTEGIDGYVTALNRICKEVEAAISSGYKIAVLSDRKVDAARVPVSALIASAGVHHYLVHRKLRSRIALVVETGEAKEVHHFCVLLGYGVDAICPYLAFEAMLKLKRDGVLDKTLKNVTLIDNYIKASNDGIKKVMSKMGISTLQSYKGAQIFEALGLDGSVIARCFAGTASRIKGVTFDLLARDALSFHELAYPTRPTIVNSSLPETGEYHWRAGGETHINEPNSVAQLQDAVRMKNQTSYEAYSKQSYEQIKDCTLRGLLDFKYEYARPIPIEEVEPWTSIVKRFCTGAMSYGSISYEAHSTIAVAMNELGGKSNTGEGGEDPIRNEPLPDGKSMKSAIKQVASGRFGVTSHYLANATELQIKLAQGAKPGEGGELPGHKVSEDIGKTRKSTPGVGLISPPPHHDIYSIEDLKQLIYDCKCANPEARVSVKLVSEVGVGIVASGVAKAKADHILISGHDGGTGASRWTGIRYAGLPWELGLAETHQTLVLNDLRGRIVLQTDGQIKTGRDVVIACLLGAEEWGFATTPLIALGCIMMRKCHLNTCPVGIATQDPELRKKFEGKPEDVINFFYYVAEECRSIMASLGFRNINDMVGRSDMLVVNDSVRTPKTANIDLGAILTPAFTLRPGVATFNVMKQDHMLYKRLDNKLIDLSRQSLRSGKLTVIDIDVVNTDRALGTTLSFEVSRRNGETGLPPNTIHIKMKGSAGQSLGAFLAPGIFIELEGDANDYVGKGLSGGRIIVYPPVTSIPSFKSEENVIVGNVCLYGATGGQALFRGIAAERFCVRNSGADAVCEGVGDHGCEYMTGGRVVILGTTGRNFAAGMSGGIAYILDLEQNFKKNCNLAMVDLEHVVDREEALSLKALIMEFVKCTGSEVGQRVLSQWHTILPKFVKVFPRDYKAVLAKKKLELLPPSVPESSDNPSTKAPIIIDIEDGVTDEVALIKKSENLDKLRGFMKYKKQTDHYRNPKKRVNDWKEINGRLNMSELKVQAARCMDCGVPFCQSTSTGCPIGNVIPKWNDLVFKNQWREALDRLLLTNNFPEFTGRVCPAPCEGSCVLGINELPVAIKSIECAIIDKGFEEGWITPSPPLIRTGKNIAIVGSGPAGLAAADQLNKAGHTVTVYDRNDRHGGLLVYGIPNMKLEKRIVQRRIELMKAEGVVFIGNAHVGKNVDSRKLLDSNDALLLCTGATWPRDLNVPNRDLDGIHFAMEYLEKNTKSLLDSDLNDGNYLNAKDKDVIVIGGGDTGNDCIGTAVRHGAKTVTNFELLPPPPPSRSKENPWPQYPKVMKVDYGHAEVQAMHNKDPREYNILTKSFVPNGKGGIKGLNTVKVFWEKDPATGRWNMSEVPNSEKFFAADLVFLAMGFLGPERKILDNLGIQKDNRSNVETPTGSYATSVPKVFAAGDCRRGQSLIVWGINEGRQAAREIDLKLMDNTQLVVSGGFQVREVLPLEE